MMKIKSLLIFTLLFFIFNGCEFIFSPDISKLFVEGDWKLIKLRLSNEKDHSIEQESATQFDKKQMYYTFNSDGTYSMSAIDTDLDFDGAEDIFKPSGTWSLSPDNDTFYFDDDTLQIITNKKDLIELQYTKTRSKELYVGDSPEKNNQLILVFEQSICDVEYKTITLDDVNSCYMFTTGQRGSWSDMPEDFQEYGMVNEPWCTDTPGICGNWAVTDYSNFCDVKTPPSGPYISDGKGYIDCQIMYLNKVRVFKLKDETYAMIKIVKDIITSNDQGCKHTITVQVVYPAFE